MSRYRKKNWFLRISHHWYRFIIDTVVLKDIPFFESILDYESPIKNFHLYVSYYLWIGSFVILLLGEFYFVSNA